ncbi:cytochrome c biogenesis protein ResB [Syntrophomonas erecta subsp. sporosyntropha]
MLNFLASMKVGLTLLALLTICSILATFQPDTTMYSSILYRILLVLLSVNLLLCTGKRLPGLFCKLGHKITEEELEKFNLSDGDKTNHVEEAFKRFIQYFSETGFAVQHLQNKSRGLMIATKGKGDLIAPPIIHFSILVIVIGAMVGTMGASRNINCYPDTNAPIPASIKNGYSIELISFKTLYDDKNELSNWQSKFKLLKDGTVVTEGVTEVNKPFKYQGMKFYQSAYGNAHKIMVRMGDMEKELFFESNQPIQLMGNTSIVFTADGNRSFLNKYENGYLTEITELVPGQKIMPVEGLEMTYIVSKPYSVLNVKTDPGVPIVMTGFVLLSMGFILFWFGRYQEVKIMGDCEKNTIGIFSHGRNKSLQEKLYQDLKNLI